MARKRMFDTEIINRDSFLDLSLEAKAIYFLLGIFADDEGFISPKKILRLYGGSEKMLIELIQSEFIIQFESGVVLITDWKRNNYLDQNKVRETIYIDEKKQIEFNEKSYKYESLNKVKPVLNESLTNYEIEENRIVKNNLEKNRENENSEEIICINSIENIPYKEIIEYLNFKTGHNYKYNISKTQKLIQSRINEGFEIDDFKVVIDKKYDEWKNTDMEKYLRPETLFGPKFEGYLNQNIIAKDITTDEIAKYIDWNEYLSEQS